MLPWPIAYGFRILISSPFKRALMQSGTKRSAAQSPPPITFPALTEAKATPCKSYDSGLKKELRYDEVINSCTSLAVRIRIIATHRISFSISPNPFFVFITFIRGNINHSFYRFLFFNRFLNRFKKINSSHHICLICVNGILIGGFDNWLCCHMKNDFWFRINKAEDNASRFRISPIIVFVISCILHNSKRLGSVGGSNENPVTSPPRNAAINISHEPLKPVWPVINTFFPFQNSLSIMLTPRYLYHILIPYYTSIHFLEISH